MFCLDDRLLHGRHTSGSRVAFLLQCLDDLDGQLSARGGCLTVRHGAPEEELPALARQTGATEVHLTRDDSPCGRWRGRRVRRALAAARVAVVEHPGLSVADDASSIRTAQGRPYTVFTPFYRNWSQAPRRPPLAAPERVPPPGRLRAGAPPPLAALGLRAEAAEPDRGGETEGTARLERFLRGHVRDYAAARDLPGAGGSSRLSAYLRFGCVSPRALEAALPPGEGPAAFRRQLCWRDFYHQVLACHPGNARHEHQARYRGTLAWNRDDQAFTAWAEGRTGFPLVDAGLRQLRREGWMHGRARLLAASFLTKDLGLDWRLGEAWFMRWLLDGDMASNNGNWQWVTSVGVDPQPAFRRLYHPSRQRDRHDPDGSYVRAQVPELALVPDRHLSEPWLMPDDEQRRTGCRIGRDYPAPMVDHRAARQEALARFRAAAAG